jgi:hypothetical protein
MRFAGCVCFQRGPSLPRRWLCRSSVCRDAANKVRSRHSRATGAATRARRGRWQKRPARRTLRPGARGTRAQRRIKETKGTRRPRAATRAMTARVGPRRPVRRTQGPAVKRRTRWTPPMGRMLRRPMRRARWTRRIAPRSRRASASIRPYPTLLPPRMRRASPAMGPPMYRRRLQPMPQLQPMQPMQATAPLRRRTRRPIRRCRKSSTRAVDPSSQHPASISFSIPEIRAKQRWKHSLSGSPRRPTGPRR